MEMESIDRSLGHSKRYDSVGCCIYCGATSKKLEDEHIIPYGIAGDGVIFRDASCRDCAKVINEEFEDFCLSLTLFPFRMRVDAPSRGKKRRRGRHQGVAEIPLKIIPLDKSFQPLCEAITVKVPAKLYPTVLMGWRSPAPGIIRGAPPSELIEGEAWTRYNAPEFSAVEKAFCESTGHVGPLQIKVGDLDPAKFLRFIAKTAHAHAYAVAELGYDAFRPLLPDLILGRSKKYSHLIGGTWEIPEPLESEQIFQLQLGKVVGDSLTYHCVSIQIFPFYGSPIHTVIVGEEVG
jgi:hypothetical protein